MKSQSLDVPLKFAIYFLFISLISFISVTSENIESHEPLLRNPSVMYSGSDMYLNLNCVKHCMHIPCSNHEPPGGLLSQCGASNRL